MVGGNAWVQKSQFNKLDAGARSHRAYTARQPKFSVVQMKMKFCLTTALRARVLPMMQLRMSAQWRRPGESSEDSPHAEFVSESQVCAHCTRRAGLVANHASVSWGHEPWLCGQTNRGSFGFFCAATPVVSASCAGGYTAIGIRWCCLRRLAGGTAGCPWLCNL